MNKQTHPTYQLDALSLLPLRMILTQARKDSPPRVFKTREDVNEELALKLIEGMKARYRKPLSLVSIRHGLSGQIPSMVRVDG